MTALSLSALKPGTTYYVLTTARPHPDDDINICNTADCGAVELAVTTLAGTQPAYPVPPMNWVPGLPDTTGYTVIPLQVGGTGECQAVSTVTNGSWTVTAGMYVAQILNTIGYGTVLELPQGVSCKVPSAASGIPGYGYILPSIALDNNCSGACTMTDTRHRWIIFRTKQLAAADFPPYGSRITPDFAPVLGKFYSAQPNNVAQLFSADGGPVDRVHHIWFQNVEFLDDPAYVNPPDYVDPVGFTYFARVGSQYQPHNNQFLVFDRVYAHGPGAPIRHIQGYEIAGNYMAMVGCYTSQVEAWRMTAWPSYAGTLNASNNLLSIPQNNFRFAKASRILGMPGTATVTLSGTTGAGTIIGNLYKDHLEVQYTAGTARLSCKGCTLTAATTPSTPPTAIQLFTGSINTNAGGQFANLNWNIAEYQTTRYLFGFGIQNSDLQAPGGPWYFENNYLDGVGEGFYMDPTYSAYSSDDVTWTHNHQIWPKHYFDGDPNNQWRYEVRQHWESKRVHRVLFRGNLFSWSWSYQNPGMAIYVAATPVYITQPGATGVSDVKIESNIISHGRTGIDCAGSSALDNGGNGAEPAPAKRVQIVNNLMFDLGGYKYCDSVNCPGVVSPYIINRPGCQDLLITNNTAGPIYGIAPAILQLGGGTNLSNYLQMQKNVLYFARGTAGYGGGNFGDWPGNFVANHDVKPAATYVIGGSAPSFKTNLDQSFVNIGATVTPNYVWNQNVIIGSWMDTNSGLSGVAELSAADLNTYAANMPAGDIYVPGNTQAARELNLKFPTPVAPLAGGGTIYGSQATQPSPSNPGGIGVDYVKLVADQGLVTGVQAVQVSATVALLQYTAPDSRACVVDVGPGNTSTWTSRTADGGGARKRSVTVSGLTAATAYQHRILCYYKQVNDGVLYLDFQPDQITDGSFRTATAGTGIATVPFRLSNIPNAAKIQVTLTPVSGTPVISTCTTSPCRVTVNNGDHTLNVQYLSAANQSLSSGSGHLKVQ